MCVRLPVEVHVAVRREAAAKMDASHASHASLELLLKDVASEDAALGATPSLMVSGSGLRLWSPAHDLGAHACGAG